VFCRLRLTRGTDQHRVCRSGSGHRGDAFCYWLPGREPLLWPGNSASEEEKQAWRERWHAETQRRRADSLTQAEKPQ
jgi:hypothetical protein